MSKYHIKAETSINAPIQKIWEVMTSTGKYQEWNSFIRKIDVDSKNLEPGTKMQFEVEFKNKKRAKSGEIVKHYSPPKENNGKWEAEWIYDFTGILHNIGMVRATRTQKLTQLENGSVHYYTCEKFSGWGKIFLPLKNVQAGFLTHASDLKKYCEKL